MIQFIGKYRILLSRVYLLALIAAIFSIHSSWDPTGVASYILRTAGFILVFAGVFGRLWSSLYICGSKNLELVRLGPYSITRNPLYVFSLLGGIGIGLGTESLVITAMIILMFILIYPATIMSEERKLADLFGETFQQYIREVPRFFPKISLYKGAQQFEIRVDLFIKAIFDSIWFLLIFWGVQTIVQLHEQGVLPYVWVMP